jgi:hypothetical protein
LWRGRLTHGDRTHAKTPTPSGVARRGTSPSLLGVRYTLTICHTTTAASANVGKLPTIFNVLFFKKNRLEHSRNVEHQSGGKRSKFGTAQFPVGLSIIPHKQSCVIHPMRAVPLVGKELNPSP